MDDGYTAGCSCSKCSYPSRILTGKERQEYIAFLSSQIMTAAEGNTKMLQEFCTSVAVKAKADAGDVSNVLWGLVGDNRLTYGADSIVRLP